MQLNMHLPTTSAARVVDLFAGWGGFTEGAEMAGANVVFAANHWPLAVKAHALNHPATAHACQDLRALDWSSLPEHDIMLAAPACQTHSQASQPQRAAALSAGRKVTNHDALRETAHAVLDAAEVSTGLCVYEGVVFLFVVVHEGRGRIEGRAERRIYAAYAVSASLVEALRKHNREWYALMMRRDYTALGEWYSKRASPIWRHEDLGAPAFHFDHDRMGVAKDAHPRMASRSALVHTYKVVSVLDDGRPPNLTVNAVELSEGPMTAEDFTHAQLAMIVGKPIADALVEGVDSGEVDQTYRIFRRGAGRKDDDVACSTCGWSAGRWDCGCDD